MSSVAASASRPEGRSIHDHLVRLGGIARGRYALPTAGDAETAAARLSGVATGRSAAAH